MNTCTIYVIKLLLLLVVVVVVNYYYHYYYYLGICFRLSVTMNGN